ncbi:chaperone required for assembly of F1-ATPase [Borreliella californiensis]|uniref:Chaperone required for assembly of F1-ATPase n=2 Tax=Borreliella californiensis TaxID=373543 RepID=A0A7W9ZNN0_9SPIR|nr:chaperone required for assembly of F1-ATPase [Borreliella californiensis]MBB6213554.1 chaperone required for assembly of F1-ATPase [Borreliella californiensis]
MKLHIKDSFWFMNYMLTTKLIYKTNIERLESALTPTITNTLAPINEKINHCIDLVNSDEKNLKISNDLKFNKEDMLCIL